MGENSREEFPWFVRTLFFPGGRPISARRLLFAAVVFALMVAVGIAESIHNPNGRSYAFLAISAIGLGGNLVALALVLRTRARS